VAGFKLLIALWLSDGRILSPGELLMFKHCIIVLMVSLSLPLGAAEMERVTVRKSSVSANTVLISAVLAGKTIELMCNLKRADCVTLEPGQYFLVQPSRRPSYNDCVNVDVYGKAPDSKKDTKVGLYCRMDWPQDKSTFSDRSPASTPKTNP